MPKYYKSMKNTYYNQQIFNRAAKKKVEKIIFA